MNSSMNEINRAKWKELWEDFYAENKYSMWYPDESTIKLFGKLSKDIDFKDLKALDLGCGVGRNTVFLSEKGLDAIGIDISKNAIELAKENAKKNGQNTQFSVYDGKTLPFEDNFFDFIISFGVLDHIPMEDALRIMEEVKRTLKDGGICKLELHAIYDSQYGYRIGKNIEKNVFIIEDKACEVGLPQHYFDKEEVLALTDGFTIENIYLHEDRYLDNESLKEIGTRSIWVIIMKKN